MHLLNNTKKQVLGLPWWSSSSGTSLLPQGEQVPSLAGMELRSCLQSSQKKTKKKAALTEAHVTGEQTEAGIPKGSAVGGGSYPDPGCLPGGFLPKSTGLNQNRCFL